MQDLMSKGGMQDEVYEQINIAKKCQFGIVEIGVLYGETSRKFCLANPHIPVCGIDPLIPDSMNPNLVGSKKQIEKNTSDCKNFYFYQDYSFNIAEGWIRPFDYLFIDASHIYQDVKMDFEDWFKLLLPGGLVSLHDSAAHRGGPYHWDGPSLLADELISDDRVDYVKTVYSLTIFRKK